ncbi:FHA domain-containing protein [bacterium]|nr:FHA domain-containing protein [bacterium]
MQLSSVASAGPSAAARRPKILPQNVAPPGPGDSLEVRGVCFGSDGKAVMLPEKGQSMTLGRDSRSSLVFEQSDVSRKHAEIVEKDGKHYLRDLGSTCGTYLNGQKLESDRWVEFAQGDRIRLGSQASLSRSLQDLPEEMPALPLPGQGQAVTVGRSPDNGLVTPWAESSRSHAVIRQHNGESWLLDQGSTNGTLINGLKIPSQQWFVLQPGQVVQFGSAPGAAFLVQEEAKPTALQGMSGARDDTILGKAKFAPNPLGIRALNAADCTREFLEAQGLEPRLTFACGDQKIHVSRPYQLDGQRTACVGYVEDQQGNVRVRAFYRSNSQGIWRSASHAGFQGWIGKGAGESSTNLPMELQQHLNVQADAQVKPMDTAAANQAFYGCLEFGGAPPPAQLLEELGEPRPFGHFGSHLPGGKYGVPESFAYRDRADAPDFSQPGVAYNFQHPMHGPVTARVFHSHNEKVNYLFYQDQHQRSWIAQVEETGSVLTSWGTRQNPLSVGDLAMPALEYPEQIPAGYAGNMVGPDYADASAYVHRLPPVAEFRRAMAHS